MPRRVRGLIYAAYVSVVTNTGVKLDKTHEAAVKRQAETYNLVFGTIKGGGDARSTGLP